MTKVLNSDERLTGLPSRMYRSRGSRVEPSRPGADFFLLVHLVLAAVVVIWLNSGVGTVLLTQVPGAYKWAIAAAWIATSLLSLRHAVALASSLWPLILFLGLALLAIPRSDGAGQAYLQNVAYMMVAYCIYSFYSASEFHRYRRAIVALVLLDVALVGLRTWSALDINPDISRYLATGITYEDIVALTADMWGVGGYPYAYALPVIMLVFLHRAITRKRYTVLAWAVVLLGTLLLVKMAFTIAVIMWAAFAVLLIAGETIGRLHQRGVVLIGLFVIPIGILLAPTVLSIMATAAALPDVIAVRLQELAGLLAGERGSNTDLGTRINQYGISLQELSKNWLSGSTGSGTGMGSVGAHSSWLDSLGAFGLVSLSLFFFLALVLRRQLSHVAPSEHFVLKLAWTYFAVLGIINTLLFAHVILVWFVLLPFMLQPDDLASAAGEAT